MKSRLMTVALVLAIGAGGPALAASNRAAAKDFIRLAFQQHDLKAAFDKYVAKDLIEHDPEFGDGRDSVFVFMDKRRREHPEYLPTSQWKTVVDYVGVDGDMLITKMHTFSRPNDRGRVFADFWRFKDGKIVEHWDVIQEVPADKANPRPMW